MENDDLLNALLLPDVHGGYDAGAGVLDDLLGTVSPSEDNPNPNPKRMLKMCRLLKCTNERLQNYCNLHLRVTGYWNVMGLPTTPIMDQNLLN